MDIITIMNNNLPWLWVAVTVICIVIEILTMSLTTIWFAISSFVMVFLAFTPIPFIVQVFLFVVLSLILLIFTRPIVQKKLVQKKIATNYERIIGQIGIVTKKITLLEKGTIKINGMEWTAAVKEDIVLEKGCNCEIEEIAGVTAYVKKNRRVKMIYVLIAVIVIAMILIIANIRIVSQSDAFVIERLGGYHTTWNVGLHVKLPLLDRIAKKVSLKEKVFDFPPQPVITKDNVTMMIDTVVYFQITDPKLYTYGVEKPINALENLSATTLRNIIGELELDESLTSRDVINTKMRSILDEATDPWGIKVNRVEVKNIEPPQAIREAMEKQMKAERERREQILIAEGHKQSAILEAEGQKQAMILAAEAEKEAAVQKAMGEAQAILEVQKATADGLKMLKEVKMDEAVLKFRSLETMEKAANGQATKIIVPADFQNLAGVVSALSEIAKK